MNDELHRWLFSGHRQGTTWVEMVRQAKASVKDVDLRRSWILLGEPTVRVK